jgi:hypothetical protein
MIAFKQVSIASEMRLLHPRLAHILGWIGDTDVWRRTTGCSFFVITCLFRSRDQTVKLYEEAGKAPPAVSVHECVKLPMDPWSGCRGADISARRPSLTAPYGQWEFLPDDVLHRFVEEVNSAWRYHEAERYNVALYHSVSGPHVHLQVARLDETKRR